LQAAPVAAITVLAREALEQLDAIARRVGPFDRQPQVAEIVDAVVAVLDVVVLEFGREAAERDVLDVRSLRAGVGRRNKKQGRGKARDPGQ
jgi:hypothetical protein